MAFKDIFLKGTGSDSNTGTLNSPVKTPLRVSQIISAMPASDIPRIYLYRGDEFRGTISSNKFGIDFDQRLILDSYGDAQAEPVLTGGINITNIGWTQYSTNKWKASLAETPFLLYKNGEIMTRARDDNNGKFYLVTANSAKDSIGNGADNIITIGGLNRSSSLFNGVRVYGRFVQWEYDTRRVDTWDNTTKKMTVMGTIDGKGITNFRYAPTIDDHVFFDNHITYLTKQDYWFYDTTAKEIHIYSTTNPNTFGEITASVNLYGFHTDFGTTKKYGASIKNINFKCYGRDAIRMHGYYGHVEIANCKMSLLRKEGIRIKSDTGINSLMSNDISIHNNEINNACMNGIYTRDVDNLNVYENNISNIAMGLYGLWDDLHNDYGASGNGVRAETTYHSETDSVQTGINIYKNTIDKCYQGIHTDGAAVDVWGNIITNFCWGSDDYGGIYMWGGKKDATKYMRAGNKIHHNFITAPYKYAPAEHIRFNRQDTSIKNGIYLDEGCFGVEVYNNFVMDGITGMMVNYHTTQINIHHNVFASREACLILRSDEHHTSQNQRYDVQHNTFIALSSFCTPLDWAYEEATSPHNTVIDFNRYMLLYNNAPVKLTVGDARNGSKYRPITDNIKNYYNFEANGKFDRRHFNKKNEYDVSSVALVASLDMTGGDVIGESKGSGTTLSASSDGVSPLGVRAMKVALNGTSEYWEIRYTHNENFIYKQMYRISARVYSDKRVRVTTGPTGDFQKGEFEIHPGEIIDIVYYHFQNSTYYVNVPTAATFIFELKQDGQSGGSIWVDKVVIEKVDADVDNTNTQGLLIPNKIKAAGTYPLGTTYEGLLRDYTSVTVDHNESFATATIDGSKIVMFNEPPANDGTIPKITLAGGTVIMNVGEIYYEPGYSAYDNEDGELPVTVTGLVDNTKPGIYILTYYTEDSSGYSDTTTRAVHVNDVIAPGAINHSQKGTIIHDGSGPYGGFADRAATSAFDNNDSTFYDPVSGTNTFVGRDMEVNTTLNAILVFPRNNAVLRVNNAILQYSTDNTNWTNAVTITGYVSNTDTVRRKYSFPEVSARYWRLFSANRLNVNEVNLLYEGTGDPEPGNTYEREILTSFVSDSVKYKGKTIGMHFYVPQVPIKTGHPTLFVAHGADQNSAPNTPGTVTALNQITASPGFAKYAHDGNNPGYIIGSPQLPDNGQDWEADLIKEFVAHAKTIIPEIDTNKLFLTGWSQGGHMIHNALRDSELRPKVRGIINMAGVGYPTDAEIADGTMASGNPAIWAFSSQDDSDFIHGPNQTYKLTTTGNKYRTSFTSGGHSGAVTNALYVTGTASTASTTYGPHPNAKGENIHQFIINEYNGTISAPENAIPSANAGTDKTIELPTNSVQLNGSGTDSDGTIASYFWSQVSGPNTAVFSSTNVSSPTVSSLVAGTYVFRLTVRDNVNASATDDVTVTVTQAANQAPVLTLNGSNPMTVTVGDNWSATDPGANMTDDNDVNKTIFSTVDTSTAGTKTATYSYTDGGGLTTTITRTVNVQAATGSSYTLATRPPASSFPEDTVISVTDLPIGTQQKVVHGNWVTINRKVIFDTDWWTDCDDVIATRILVHLEKLGYIDLEGVAINTSAGNGISSLHAFLTHEGRGDVRLAIPKTSHIANGTPNYQQRMVDNMPYTATLANTGNAVNMYRELLANTTGKIDIISVGFLNNLKELLESPADGYSGLTGTQLVAEKVNMLYIMGGTFPSGKEHNFSNSNQAISGSVKVAADWPTPIVFLGFEVGHPVISGSQLDTEAPDDPVTLSMADNGFPGGRRSWDPMTVLLAGAGTQGTGPVDFIASGYTTVRGTINVAADGSNTFTQSSSGNHYYLVKQLSDTDYAARLDSFLVPGQQTTKLPLTVVESTGPETGTDYSQTGTIIDDGSGPYNGIADRAAYAAFDRDKNTFYDPVASTNTYVGRDMGSSVTLNKLFVDPRPMAALRVNNAILQYSSDKTNWLNAVTVTGVTSDDDVTRREFTFTKTSARYWRLFSAERLNVVEVGLFYDGEPTDPATPPTNGITDDTNNTFTFSLATYNEPALTFAATSGGTSLYESYLNGSDGTETQRTYVSYHKTHTSGYDYRIGYHNHNNNPIYVKAAIEYPQGTYHALTLNGTREIEIGLRGTLIFDPLNLSIPAGTNFWVRTHVRVASAGQKWPLGLVNHKSEPNTGKTSQGDFTLSSAGLTAAYMYSPSIITSRTNAPEASVLIVGDSIAYSGGRKSYLDRAFNDAGIGYVNIASQGEQANHFATDTARFATRMELISHAKFTHAVYEYGANDVSRYSLSQMQSDAVTCWNKLKEMGVKVYATTLTPYANGTTDSWATAGGQSLPNFSGRRIDYNDWIRSIPAPLDGYIEVADVVEVNSSNVLTRNGGRWLCNGSANYTTNDGLHPVENGAQIIANGIVNFISTNIII